MGKKSRRKREGAAQGRAGDTPGQLLASWQKVLLWVAWLGWFALLAANSASVYMGWKEFGGLALAITCTVLCLRNPMGGNKRIIRQPEEVRGSFESRTNWALVLIGALLMLGGVAAIVKMFHDWRSGHITIGGIFSDMGVFIIQWYRERISGGVYDGELEKTGGYILFVLLFPGLFMFLFCLMPWLFRGVPWKVDEESRLSVWREGGWQPVREEDYAVVQADGVTIAFKPSEDAQPTVVLPQDRVYSRELNTRVADHVLARFFREWLEEKKFTVESRTKGTRLETAWIARRIPKPQTR